VLKISSGSDAKENKTKSNEYYDTIQEYSEYSTIAGLVMTYVLTYIFILYTKIDILYLHKLSIDADYYFSLFYSII